MLAPINVDDSGDSSNLKRKAESPLKELTLGKRKFDSKPSPVSNLFHPQDHADLRDLKYTNWLLHHQLNHEKELVRFLALERSMSLASDS
jgi:hypothetical protein